MPIVKVSYRPPIMATVAKDLAVELPRIVANALTCDNPDGGLTTKDVEIEVRLMHPGLQTAYDLHIEVEANEYPERRENLERRTHQILLGVRTVFNSIPFWKSGPPRGWVWVKLFPAHWG